MGNSTERPWRDTETVQALYWGLGMTQAEVATVFECSERTVSRWMDRLGVDTRPGGRTTFTADQTQLAHPDRFDDRLLDRLEDNDYVERARGTST